MKQGQSGFTLVEIAIVLVIIGLLLGGILKGQELISNAKVRNVADQQSAIKAAYFAFQDRFRAIPGDYTQATANIPNTTTAPAANGDGQIQLAESAYAWQQLTNAGFVSCSPCANNPPASPASPAAANSPTNAFGGLLYFISDTDYAFLNAGVGTNTGAPQTNNLKSGGQIPSNVLAEVDRKIDDGNPYTGAFRFSLDTAVASNLATCVDTTQRTWVVVAPGPIPACGAANTL